MQKKNLPVSVDDAVLTAEELDAVSDELNTLLTEAEERLRSLGLGVAGEVQLDVDHKLVFRKFNDKWCFVIEATENSRALPRALLDGSVPRKIRVLAASNLQELFGNMTSRAARMTKDVHEARDAVKKFIKTIE